MAADPASIRTLPRSAPCLEGGVSAAVLADDNCSEWRRIHFVSNQVNQFDRDTLARVGRLMFRARRIVEGARAGAHRSPLHGASVEFSEHKDYTPGDELKHVDWKLYGKSDKYYVKRYEEETNLHAHILLDLSASMGYGRASSGMRTLWQRLTGVESTAEGNGDDLAPTRSKHEYAVLLAAALAYLLVHQGDAVGLYQFSGEGVDFVPPRARASHLHTLMDRLAQAQVAGSGGIADALQDFAPRVKRRGVIILISDLLEDPESLLHAMKDLRTHRNDVVIFHLLHADELEFPFEEVSQFIDPEAQSEPLITDPREIRSGYLTELNRFLELVRRRCHEGKVDYRLINTQTPVARVMAEFVAGRAGGRRLARTAAKGGGA